MLTITNIDKIKNFSIECDGGASYSIGNVGETADSYILKIHHSNKRLIIDRHTLELKMRSTTCNLTAYNFRRPTTLLIEIFTFLLPSIKWEIHDINGTLICVHRANNSKLS